MLKRVVGEFLTAKGPGSIPVWGTKNPTDHTMWPKKKSTLMALWRVS